MLMRSQKTGFSCSLVWLSRLYLAPDLTYAVAKVQSRLGFRRSVSITSSLKAWCSLVATAAGLGIGGSIAALGIRHFAKIDDWIYRPHTDSPFSPPTHPAACPLESRWALPALHRLTHVRRPLTATRRHSCSRPSLSPKPSSLTRSLTPPTKSAPPQEPRRDLVG